MQNDIKRSQIVEAAKSFLGTRWKHQGRDRRGVDCVGLLVAIADALECTPKDLIIPPYGRQPDGSLMEYFRLHMTQVPLNKLKAGTALVFEFGGSPYHAGVLIDPARQSFVHAYAARKKVVYDVLNNNQQGRKLTSAWDFHGVVDG